MTARFHSLLVWMGIALPILFVFPPFSGVTSPSTIEGILAPVFLIVGLWIFLTGRRISGQANPGLYVLAIPFLFFSAFATLYTFRTLYPGDFDYTAISEALHRTALGDGVLPTPFVETGSGSGFLAHHFSPALLLLVPFYLPFNFFPFFGWMDHRIYGFLLWAAGGTGLVLWIRLVDRSVKTAAGKITAAGLLAMSLPLFRLSASYHFEILVIPFSALFFLSWKSGSDFSLRDGILLLLWLSIKEDIAIYLILFSFWIMFEEQWQDRRRHNGVREILRRSGGLRITFLSTLWIIVFVYFRYGLTETSGPDWTGYWISSRYPPLPGPVWKSYLPFFLISGLLPFLFSLPFSLMVIGGILFIHGFSHHPWHATLYGHYSYSIAPFLFLAIVRGCANMEVWLERKQGNRLDTFRSQALWFFMFFFAFRSAAADRENPSLVSGPAKYLPDLEKMVQRIEPDSCVQTQFFFTPRIPLHSRVFPVRESGRFRAWIPDLPRNNHLSSFCRRYYLLFAPDLPLKPYYGKEFLEELRLFAQSRLDFVDGTSRIKLYSGTGIRAEGKSTENEASTRSGKYPGFQTAHPDH